MQLRRLFYFSVLVVMIILPKMSSGQMLVPEVNKNYYLIHSSGNVIAENGDGRTVIQELSGSADQLVQFVPDGSGYYWVKPAGQKKYMALSGSWNTYFVTDSTTDHSKYAIEKVSTSFVRLKCKANNQYLGTDNTTGDSPVYSDKSGTDSRHYWYISENYSEAPTDTMKYLINPGAAFDKTFEGWGVSLCWWANMCGKWSDDKIDQIVDWLVGSEGLNYNIFRYNIGGGDDPLNRNCTPHHMADGKGLRAEMEGFKDSLNADYNWNRDAAQRKIMLKIMEKRPDAIFEAFSNSAPYYMTYSGCCAGNFNASDDNVKPEYYDEFAHYLVDVCKFYKDSFGIEFKSLEPFNEPVTNYWAANGGQEGCHFSTSAQIAFLKVLSPILHASGLNTIIASSDETSTSQSVTDFNAYIQDGTAINLVEQWNTHTYSATNQARANLRALSTAHNKTLWMSETGSGGTGIAGNLNMAQKLMNDIRYIRPEAWIDWQYIEENNDQWCFLRGDFAAQTYYRVKNYYVRQQISRYIRPGSTFYSVPNDQMLAALNPQGDSLIIVLLNNSSLKVNHQIYLSLFDYSESSILATRTSETENFAPFTDYSLNDSVLTVELPGYSISTLMISVKNNPVIEEEIKPDVPYLIIPRIASLVMQSKDNSVEINDYQYGDSTQMWTLSTSGNGYYIKNLNGEYLTDAGSYFAETSLTENTSAQTFQLESVGDDSYKILSTSTGKALDLEGANNTAATKIGFYAYGTSPAASHRQWMFVLPPKKSQNIPDAVKNVTKYNDSESVRIFGTDDAIVILQTPDSASQITVYSLTGAELQHEKIAGPFVRIPFPSGIYLVSVGKDKNGKVITKKVIVK